MDDRRMSLSVSMTAVASALLWTAGGILIVVDAFHTRRLGPAGVYLTFLGAVLWIRRLIRQATVYVAGREANAFELGRDSRVRELRRH